MPSYHGPNAGSHRTFTRREIADAMAAWERGDFSEEWRDWRHLAAMQAGIIDPPDGDRWDSWTEDRPSERAILIRAIRETPTVLRRALVSGKCHTWAQVVRLVVQDRDRRAEELEQRARDAEHEKQQGPDREEARVAWQRIKDMVR